MTECERIIREGILPSSFFKAETICDFYVSEEMKKNWAVCIDLLVKFDKVCRKHQLKYFVAFGSLLGIIRHRGFIPWDDDVDVCMLRKDYMKLLSLKDEFDSPYFLQEPGCDEDYFFTFAKLRNSNTTAVSRTFRYAKFNQGVSLDIFPLDNCLPDLVEKNACDIKELIMENSANMRRSNPFLTPTEQERCNRYKSSDPIKVLEDVEYIAQQYNDRDLSWVTCATMTIYNAKKLTFLKEDVTNLKDIDFYGYRLYIPANYDKILKTTYGDYMQFPPVEKRGVWHNNAVFNPDVPYTETVKLLQEQDIIQNK